MSVSPKRRAASTARLEGAETAHTIGIPAVAAFWMISKLARPETRSTPSDEREVPGEQLGADQLVDGIVPADVFERADEPARRVEERDRVQTARLVEQALHSPELVWKPENRRRRDDRPVAERSALDVDHVQRRFAADAAARRGVEVALRPELELASDRDADDVVVLLFTGNAAITNALDICLAGDQALGEEEAGGEREVVAGRAHRDRDAALLGTGLIDPDLHRLFRREAVAAGVARSRFDPDDLDPGRAARSSDLRARTCLGRVIHRSHRARRPAHECGRRVPERRARPQGSGPRGSR